MSGRWVFLRLLGVVYLMAFASLWTQVIGLMGHDGILPAERLLQAAQQQLGPERYWILPTVCWLNASDAFLQGLCAAGVLLALLLVCDLAPALLLFLLWAAYLSLVSVGREFLSFQWDNLLLEAGFLAIFLAPLRLRASSTPRRGPRPLAVGPCSGSSRASPSTRPSASLGTSAERSRGTSGASRGTTKWGHGLCPWGPTGDGQPSRTMRWLLRWLAIELLVPFLIFGPRRLRHAACATLVAFQLLIAATGNYGFFNVLTIALCVLLLDEAVWPRWLRERIAGTPEAPRAKRWPAWTIAPLAAAVLLVTGVEMSGLFLGRVRWPQPVLAMVRWTQPFRTFNGYGLFAVMTTSRPEIIVEGSRDGRAWTAYEFTYKPGDVHRPPRFVAPHQPRLDWQMWFAALGRSQDNPWFLRFCERLLQGSPEVLALLANNPFPGAPPRYVRAVVYDYRFTDTATRRAEGTWWRRELKGWYCPVLSLQRD